MPQAQQLGRYLLLDRIAYGGMAEIFRAKTFDGQGRAHLVAVKRVLSHLVEDDEFLQMIVDEAKISALLHHDNIAQLYEFGHAGNEYFLAMEYVDGKDLRAVMERVRALGRSLPLEHAAFVAMETALALHAAHVQRDAKGQFLRIVHRDVSPSNVLCSYRGEVKLCDFGIAKATLTRIQTKTGVIKGKVKYMSPEQALGRKLDHRSDLFSLGTVLYEMLALAAPFSAQTEVELIFAVREARKRPITDHRPEVPLDFVAIIDKAMSRSRSGRYQSGEELAGDLQRFLDGYKPGYRRGHFSQFIRTIFQEEIENELRHLEEFEVDGADESQVGENLIADALGEDAPFTRFTPLARGNTGRTDLSGMSGLSGRSGVSAARVEEALAARPRAPVAPPATTVAPPQVPGLHQQRTMMIDRAQVGLAAFARGPERPGGLDRDKRTDESKAPGSPWEDEETQHKEPPISGQRIHEEQTRLHPLPALQTAVASRNIHDEDTGRRQAPTGSAAPGAGSGSSGVPARFHDEKTGAKLLVSPVDLSTGVMDEEEELEEIEELEPDYVEGSLHDELTKLLRIQDFGGRLRDPSLPPPKAAEPTMMRRRPVGIEDEGAGTNTNAPTRAAPRRSRSAGGELSPFGTADHDGGSTSVPLSEGDIDDLMVDSTGRGSVDSLFEHGTTTDRRPEASEITSVPLDESDISEVSGFPLEDADLQEEAD